MKLEYLERAIHIATDNISSAQQILKDTLDLLFDFSLNNSGTANFEAELKSLSTAMSDAQSQMSALSNICKLVISASYRLKPDKIGPYLDALRKKVGEASSKTASETRKLISNGKCYATLSQSEFVIKSFEQAAAEKRFATIYVMESRPLFEGRQTARVLKKMGHRSILVSDASIEFFINEIDSAFVGADSILSDGTLVNKIGSYPLAACCAANKKNFYVVTSVLKYDPERTVNNFVNKAESAHEIFANSEFEVKNFYFDKVNPEFITAIITEVGSVLPLSVFDKLNPAMSEIYS
jgi:translation initiation factor 2B subunit (eIF-2B alpha/beta/delta family)